MARISATDIDLLRDKADIVEIVSGYTQLKKAGGHTFKGLCPFHSEKTPSFTVDTARNLFHCLAGETGVMTWQGTIPIAKLSGDKHRLLTTGGRWVDAEIKSFGIQRLWRIDLSRNRMKKTIYATDGHRWFVKKDGSRKKEVLTKDLRPGQRLVSTVATSGVAHHRTEPSAFGVAQGFSFGDGHRNGRYGTIAFFDGDKDSDLLKYFPGATVRNSGGRLNIGQLPSFFKDLPSLDEAPGYLYGWLAGYFAADGCVSTDGQVILSSASREHLEFVRTLANRLGIGTYGIKHQSRRGFPDREKSDLFHITFMNSTLKPEFFVLKKHRNRFEATMGRVAGERRRWSVVSVEPTDREEEVFCAVVPGTHAFVLEDNILTGNCFGCSEGGNVYQFVQKVENLPFPEAVEWLARRLGYDLHYEDEGPGSREASSKRRRLLEANKEAMTFFHNALLTHPEAEEARRYLTGRGFGKEVAERWKLGWGPGRNSLCKHLLAKGFKQDEIVAADLGRISDRDGALYDSFRQRIIFPTWSVQGDVVAFGARAMGDQQPKYLNTSETPVFSKSRFMYGLDRAKSSLARDNSAVVVEGYTDVIALHEAGVVEAVATNGTALGESHFEQLKKFTSRAVLMFDADDAGKSAAEKGWGLNSRVGVEVLVAPLPPGRDPAEVAQQDGAEGIRKILETAQPIRRFILEQRIAKHRIDTPEARAAALEDVVPVLISDPNPISQHEYVFLVARRIGIEPEAVQRAIAEGASRPLVATEGGPRPAVSERRLPGHVKVEREALQLLLTKPGEAVVWLDDVEEADFTSPARRELFSVAAEGARTGRGADASVSERLSEETLSLFTELAVGGDDDWDDERIRQTFVRLQVFRLERDIKKKKPVAEDINPLVEPDRHLELFTEIAHLQGRRRDLLKSLESAS